MKFLFGILRIVFMYIILGGIFFKLIDFVYYIFGVSIHSNIFNWITLIAFLMLYFVLYINKVQFIGNEKTSRRKKLPISITATIISCSLFLLIIAPFVG
ncbi:hypothetical protein CN514_12145 [Bacillus sp. AFS001701]|nr:hypothetical protein CN514_12145 [Bacillus sp. AFS001701]